MSVIQTIAQQAEMDPTKQTIRQPATALFTIDSADRKSFNLTGPLKGYRLDSQTPNQFQIQKNQPLMTGYFTRISLTEFNMNWNAPNVIATGQWKNNTLFLRNEDEVTTYTVVVDEGFYSPNELATFIQTELVTDVVFGTATWTVVWDNRNSSFRINSGSNDAFRIEPQNLGPNDDLCNLMGYGNASPDYTFIAVGNYATMLYTPYFDIQSGALTRNQNVSDNSSAQIIGYSTVARIYMTSLGVTGRQDSTVPNVSYDCDIVGTRPFTLHREFSVPKQMFWNGTEFLAAIDLRFVDYKGRTLYAVNQVPFTAGGGIATSYAGDSSEFQMTLFVTES